MSFRSNTLRTTVIVGALASLRVSAATEEPVAHVLTGPFAELKAYCAALPSRSLSEGDEEADKGFTCVPSSNDAEPKCPAVEFKPIEGGSISAATLLAIRGGRFARDRCLLAWHSNSGWFVDEEPLRMDNERHYDKIVATLAIPTRTGHGLVAKLRLRFINLRRDRDAEPHPDCYDRIALYGIGISDRLSVIKWQVGSLYDCDAIAWQGKQLPPSRWDRYLQDRLLPDGRLRFQLVGRRAKGSSLNAWVGDHRLEFP
jgi:hypothetical protein